MRSFFGLTILLLFFGGELRAAPLPYDLIIEHGTIVDGTGHPAYAADVAIQGEKIVRIGKLDKARAKRRIDARGLVVSPGFIDMLGQSEFHLLIDSRAMSKVMMGVTTEITGEGESVAPVNDRLLKESSDYLTHYHLQVDWTSLGEYFRRLEKQGLGLNLGTYVGATTVREIAVGYDDHAPTAEQLAKMRTLVGQAMEEGALGISTALQYVPARFAKTDELVELAKVAHRYGGLYATHQRSEADAIDESLQEVQEIARRAQIPVEIFHLKTAYHKNWGRMPAILQQIEKARQSGLDIGADIYPYIAASTSLSASLPPWALEGGTEKTMAQLKDPAARAKMKKEIGLESKDWENIYLGSGGPSGVLIANVVHPEVAKYMGKRLSEVATEMGKDPLDALFDLLIADNGQTDAIYFVMQEEDVQTAMRSPFVSFCTDSGARALDGPLSEGRPHPRGFGTFARILGHYVRDLHTLSLEEAIHKMTGLPAARVKLANRGTLKEGWAADVVLFDPMRISDPATFDDPKRYATGIPYVIINGQLTVDQGKRTDARAGKVLRGPGYKAAAKNPGA